MQRTLLRAVDINKPRNERKEMRIPTISNKESSFFNRYRVVGSYQWRSVNKITLYVVKEKRTWSQQ